MNDKQTQKRELKPRLRFPEFTDPWLCKELRLFLKEYLERVPSATELPIYSSTRSGLKLHRDYYDGRELINGGENRVVPQGYFVYRHMSDDGTFKFNINKTGQRIAVSKEYPVFTVADLCSDFLLHVLNDGDDFKRFALMQEKGGTRTRLYFNILCSWKPLLPSHEEQQRVAASLSSVDALITAEARKLDVLKVYKNGLMQQLFPAEGQTVPRLRFREFQDAGEWEEVKLGALGELVQGLTYSPDDVRERGLLVLRSSNIRNGEIVLDDCVYVNPQVKSANLAQTDDILICVRNDSTALIGKNALIPRKMPPCTHGAFMTIFRSRSPRFVFQLFQTPTYQKQVAADLGATINSINGSQFVKYKFFGPKPLEQQRIADCLSSVDQLIAAQFQRVDAP